MAKENPKSPENKSNQTGSFFRNWLKNTFDKESLIYKHWVPDDKCEENENDDSSKEKTTSENKKKPETPDERFHRYLETVERLKEAGILEGTQAFLTGLRVAGFGDFIASGDKKNTEK